MDDHPQLRERIKETLVSKGNLQQKVYDNTFGVFNELKEALNEMSAEFNDELDEQLDKRIRIEYRDHGKFECQFQAGGDMLIFIMHTDIFMFNREHNIWKNPYVRDEPNNAYCGMIDIYNFLAGSFKYNRMSDEGYLIGRIFVNREMQYCVEGKRQDSVRHDRFGTSRIDKGALLSIIRTAILYALDFDTLIPPYDNVKTITIEQVSTKFEHTKLQTGKRLGYDFGTDDI